MKYDLSASDQLRRIYPKEGMAPEFSREVTFQVTERCSLACFPASTKVQSFNGFISIENISPDDVICGFDEDTLQIIESRVISVSKNYAMLLYNIIAGNNNIKCTPDHPFYTGNFNYVKAKDLTIGSVIIINGESLEVTDIDVIKIHDYVYNIETSTNNYIAEGFYVHNCTYCYQINKSPKVMSWDVAKNIVDLLFKMYDDNIEGAFITKNTKMIILDFIGGEPLLEVELMDKICDYFWKTAIKKRHVWSRTFMISIATNGVAHFEPKVQEFLYKYRHHLSYSVSIDGPKEMHDACRVFPDGSGSFDLAKAAQDDFNKNFYNSIGTKATLARANLPMLSTLIKYYVGQGFEQIHANYVYEEEWNEEDAKLLYNQLKETADYILSLDKEVELALFEENFFKPKDEDDNQNWCGGTGAMLAFNPDGVAYPCIRYMESSVGDDVDPLVIGDTKGLYSTDKFIEIRDFLDGITRRSQSTDECWYCPIGEGCSWCSAWNYQYMGSPNRRCTNICVMHKARSLANIYFWNKKYQKEGQKKTFKRWLTDDEALKIVSKEELDMLDSLINKDYEIVNNINFNYNYDDYIKSIGQNNEAKNKYAKKQQ